MTAAGVSPTVQVMVATVTLPVRSVAVTVNDPPDEVGSGSPSGIEPTHDSMPEPASRQVKVTGTNAPVAKLAPSIGEVTSGGRESIGMVAKSVVPSEARALRVWTPSPVTSNAPVYSTSPAPSRS